MGIAETSSLSTFTCTLHTQTASHTHSRGWPAPYASSHICLQWKYRFCKGWPSFLRLYIITDTRISILETLVHLYLFLIDDADMNMNTIPHSCTPALGHMLMQLPRYSRRFQGCLTISELGVCPL